MYTNASCFMRSVLSGPPWLSPDVGGAAAPPLAGMGGGADPAGLGLLNGLDILVCKSKISSNTQYLTNTKGLSKKQTICLSEALLRIFFY